ncbi:MAG: hypothetical protein U0800_16675 [Isosphaeraceae bacterium]
MSLPAPDPVPGSIDDLDLTDTPRPEFQFTPAQVRLMDGLGRKMQAVGLIGIFAGVLMLFAATTEVATRGLIKFGALSITPLAFLLVGAWTRSAGREFHAVAANPNREVTHLMSALEYQERVFRFATWMLGILAVLVAVGAVLSLASSRGA